MLRRQEPFIRSRTSGASLCRQENRGGRQVRQGRQARQELIPLNTLGSPPPERRIQTRKDRL